MVKKSDINNLFNKKTFKGNQLGKILLDGLLDQLYRRPTRVSQKDLSKMIDHLANDYEGEIYNTYVNIYAGVIDLFNYIESYGSGALLNINLIQDALKDIIRISIEHQKKLQEPVTITERQYRRYGTKYRKYLKEKSDANKKEKISVLHYLQSELELIIGEDEDSYPHLKAVLDDYDQNDKPLSPDGDAVIRKAFKLKQSYKNNDFEGESIQDSMKKTYLLVVVDGHEYDGEIKKLLKDNNMNLSLQDFKAALLTQYLNERYDHHQPAGKASELAFKDLNLKPNYFKNLDKGQDNEKLPDTITQNTALDYWIIDLPCVRLKDPRTTSDEKKLLEKLDKYLSSEYLDLFNALATDIIAKHPKMKNLLTFKNQKELLTKKMTGQQLANAGDDFYKDYISITWLRSQDDFGMWNIFPEKYQKQARFHGFSVFHESSIDDDVKEDHFTKQYEKENKDLLDTISDSTSGEPHKTVRNALLALNQYFYLYQAYKEFIDGLVYFSKDENLKEFKIPPVQANVDNKIKNYHTLRNLSLYELEKIIQDKDLLQKTQKEIITGFPKLDYSKPLITTRTPADVASYIAATFSPAENTFVSSAQVLSNIAGGDIDATK